MQARVAASSFYEPRKLDCTLALLSFFGRPAGRPTDRIQADWLECVNHRWRQCEEMDTYLCCLWDEFDRVPSKWSSRRTAGRTNKKIGRPISLSPIDIRPAKLELEMSCRSSSSS